MSVLKICAVLRAGLLSFSLCISAGLLAQTPLTNTKVSAATTTVGTYKPGAYTARIPLNLIRIWEPQKPYTLETDVYSNTRTVDEVHHSTQYLDGLGRPLQSVNWQASPATTNSATSKKDIVTASVYDQYGREQYKFLPYTSPSSDGNFKTDPFGEQSTFYGSTYISDQAAYSNETIYYSKTIFEASPLNRVSKSFAPGNSWAGSEATASERSVQLQYLINDSNDNVQAWDIGFNTTIANNTNIPVAETSSYGAGQLFKTVTVDEHANQVVEYKDKEGHVVLKKVQNGVLTATAPYTNWLCTYYVYDDLGQLRFVIPPKAVAKMVGAGNWTLQQEVIDELCFRYEYDARQRMIAKKVPGADWVFMVYDQRDRLIFTQDGNMRSKNQWMTTLYDDLNRPVQTGITVYNTTRDNLQNALNGINTPGTITTTGTNVSGIGTDVVISVRETGNPAYQASNSIVFQAGFTSEAGASFTASIVPSNNTTYSNTQTINTNPTSISGISSYVPLTITNYDDYTATSKSYDATNISKIDQGAALYADPLPAQNSVMVRGIVTSSRVRVLEDPSNLSAGNWMETATFYDDKGRAVQVQSDNYKGGKDIVTSRYDFVGKMVSSYVVHNNPVGNIASLRVKTNMDYDHMGRLKETRKQINDDNTKTRVVSHNDYDALGQLKTKKIGQQTDAASLPIAGTFLENQDLAYNIRGWLKGINWSYGASSGPTTSQVSIPSNKWFSMDLSYDWGFTTTANQYNGNISGIRWKTSGDARERAYGFSYDAVNRITKANFTQNVNTTTWDLSAGIDFTTQGLTYDENGNILSMQQNGLKITSSGISSPTIDKLTYTYSGTNKVSNKLLAVSEDPSIGTTDNKLGDFTDKNTGLNDYAYDVNGNLTSDQNKKITAIVYNHLNLPYQVSINNDDGSSKGTITYIYDAVGNKLEKRSGEVASTTNKQQSKQTYTAYIGSNVYENNVLQFFGQEEGRVRPKRDVNGALLDYVYDYFLKDHLGNVRIVLTDEHKTDAYPAATMESANAATENALYSNIDATRSGLPPGYPTNDTYTNPNSSVAKVTAATGGIKVGPSMLLKVMAGDMFNLRVSSWYRTGGIQPGSTTSPLTDIVTALSNGVPGVSGGKVLAGQLTTSTVNPAITSFLSTRDPNAITSRPKAYVNWILLDEQFNFVNSSSNSEQVPDESYFNNGTNSVRNYVHTKSNLPINANGYLYVYVSNETQNIDVFFDNLQVTHIRGPLLEETHYYPFGLTMSGISSQAAGSLENKYKYNKGSELQHKEFSDGSGLELYSTEFRSLDPQLGRWWQLDPKPDYSESPYSSMSNNPILRNDPLGDVPGDYYNEQGQHIGNDGINDNKVYVIRTTETTSQMYGKDNYDQKGWSKPITQEAAVQTEAKIKEGNFDASVQKNIVQVQPEKNMEKMVNAVSKDDGTGGTKSSNNREYSGNFTKTGVKENAPGTVGDPTKGKPAISVGDNDYHSHPSGTKSVPGGHAEWVQPPSKQDIQTATKTEYVVGMKDNTIYIYNKSGVVATIPVSTFKP